MTDNKEKSQALADQNIFDLMGDQGGTAEQKELFLNELQKVIWDDFLDNDVELLLTEEEIRPLENIITQEGATDIQKQDQIVEYLDDKIPDLEDIMLEKALKLKEDMVMERILSLEEVYADNEENTKKLQEIREMIRNDLWADANSTLNELH
ncbi:MAG: hypothetical protein LBG64_04160 [Pseudomonadales bacterium]|jgi:hypothetical protein|nr:hypothetical protein [Pseudomonadales bacterium]